jgi:short subunit dehydrogenase-like uncharacterized protein
VHRVSRSCADTHHVITLDCLARAHIARQINLVGRGENGAKVKATVGTDKGDCGYKGTAIMLTETGLTLALADPAALPVQGGGVLTTASLGMPLIERLRHAGITCSVQDAAPDSSSSGSSSSKQD